MTTSVKTAVYSAEQIMRRVLDRQHAAPTLKLAGSTITVPLERRWADLDSLATYVRSIHPEVSVRRRRGLASAHYEYPGGVIAVPDGSGLRGRWAMRQLVILHELAHHRAGGVRDGHGQVFQQHFIDLVTEQMGPEAGLILRVLIHQSTT